MSGNPLRVHVHGARGRMGSAACEAIRAAADLELCGATGRGDLLPTTLAESRPGVVVELTTPDAAEEHILAALEHGAHVVSGTTGLGDAALDRIEALAEQAGRGAIVAPNFALGVILLQRFAVQAARWFEDVEIIELHHDQKVDAPSGTALDTARRLASADRAWNSGRPPERVDLPGSRGGVEGGVPIHSVRLPGLLAHQEVMFGAEGQLLTLRHDTTDRRAFMPGLLLAIRRAPGLRGLRRSLHDLVDFEAP